MLTYWRRVVVGWFLLGNVSLAWASDEQQPDYWPPGVAPVSATGPVDRLPDKIRPDSLPGYVFPPSPQSTQPRPPVQDLPPANLGKRDYDPTLGFLPDRNPGAKQPPCPCLPLGDWWIEGYYFLGKTQNDSLPPLLTSSTSSGSPGTTVLYGPNRIEHPFRSGLEIDTGVWLDKCHDFGIEGSFFDMETNRQNFFASSNGSEILGRPYIDAVTGRPATSIISSPGTGPGSVLITSPLSFLGGDVHMRNTLFCEQDGRIDLLLGYQFIRLSDSLGITTQQPDFPGGFRTTQDNFQTVNLFNGFELGLAGEYRYEALSFDATLKSALGANWHRLDIDGYTQRPLGTTAGGFLAQPNNSGRTSTTRFAVAPSAEFRVAYRVTEHWRMFVGYDFLYISSIARPGGAVDLVLNQPASGANPQRLDRSTDFWMQGIQFGLQARY